MPWNSRKNEIFKFFFMSSVEKGLFNFMEFLHEWNFCNGDQRSFSFFTSCQFSRIFSFILDRKSESSRRRSRSRSKSRDRDDRRKDRKKRDRSRERDRSRDRDRDRKRDRSRDRDRDRDRNRDRERDHRRRSRSRERPQQKQTLGKDLFATHFFLREISF